MAPLSGKVAIITGASRGIGLAIAMALARAGASLVINGRSATHLDAAHWSLVALGVNVLAAPGDIADEAFVRHLFSETRKHFGRLDLLVNNAGAFDGGPLDTLSVEAWDRVIATNLRGPFLCMRAALGIMKEQQGGRIINIGSIASKRVRPDSAPYAASKHGLWGLTQVAALEAREYGVTVCQLNPGNIAVERRQRSGKLEDEEPMISVDSIADVALLMATLPDQVEMLETTVIPHQQKYVGRG